VRGPAFLLWPKFTGAAIVDPVVGLGPLLSFGSAIAQPHFFSPFFDDRYNRPAPAVDRHAIRLGQASRILRRVSTDKIR
jgi:hypothetical protein